MSFCHVFQNLLSSMKMLFLSPSWNDLYRVHAHIYNFSLFSSSISHLCTSFLHFTVPFLFSDLSYPLTFPLCPLSLVYPTFLFTSSFSPFLSRRPISCTNKPFPSNQAWRWVMYFTLLYNYFAFSTSTAWENCSNLCNFSGIAQP